MWNVVVFILGLEETVGTMWKAPVLLALLMLSPGSDGLFRSIYGKAHVFKPPKGNVGEPLFLTPYIEAGKFAEGECKSENHWYAFNSVEVFLRLFPHRISNTFWYCTQLFYFIYE